MTRRQLLVRCTSGMGMIALASLLKGGTGGVEGVLGSGGGQPPEGTKIARGTRGVHFAPKVKRVVYLHMAGAPSQLDLFDRKPLLDELDGKPCPAEVIAGEKFAFTRGTPKVLRSPFAFKKYGQSGMEISELLPHTAAIADDLTLIRSMRTDHFNHAPAQLFVQTGSQLVGRPSMGSWVTYGLGSENADLPGFVVLTSGGNPDGGASLWGSGFLPTKYQGVPLRSAGDPVLYVNNPPGMDSGLRKETIDAVNEMNRLRQTEAGDPEIATRIAQYEMAYRMQASVPELMEIAKEPKEVHEAYGTEPGRTSFANNCLLARRLLERGVRFVQLYHWGWDSHGTNTGDDIVHSLPQRCKETDKASAALVMDLKQRGLLDDTLVIWGGEFGRTPLNEARNGSKFFGRDHHPHAFSMWMAGGGLKKGVTLGKTDDVGYRVVEDAVHVHDLQATILHLLGIDHTKLTFRTQGRDFRLTDVHGEVVRKILA